MLREVVTEEEIAQIVSRWTSIPVSRLEEGERLKLLRLDEGMHERVVGQDEAVEVVADAVIRARSGIKDPRLPVGSFLFLGPTGVGKTELAKTLAAALFDTEDNMVRLDMSEYQERHTVSRLVGAPPGYVGYEEGGQLTEAVRRKPYSVVLLNEVEKAHPDVFNTLLQVLDDGRLTDAQGHTINFRNAIIIMTSNIGSEYLLNGITSDGEIKPDAREAVLAALRQHFPPEFLNRLDDVVLFKPLTQPEIEQIVDLMADACAPDYRPVHDPGPGEDARAFIARQGFDPVYGARPLRRYIARQVETPVARALSPATPRRRRDQGRPDRRQAGHQLRQRRVTAMRAVAGRPDVGNGLDRARHCTALCKSGAQLYVYGTSLELIERAAPRGRRRSTSSRRARRPAPYPASSTEEILRGETDGDGRVLRSSDPRAPAERRRTSSPLA